MRLIREWSLAHRAELEEAATLLDQDHDLDLLGRTVRRWANDDRVADALEILPRTLVHRDMHLGNILVGDHGTTIIDLGNAFAGPARPRRM